MKPDKFNTYFFRPDLLNEESADELNKLIKVHPWFQLAWVLYAKNLKQIKSPLFEEIAKEATIKVSNRKMFFSFLNSNQRLNYEDFDTANSFTISDEKEINDTVSNSLIDRFLSSNPGSLKRNSQDKTPAESNVHNDILEKSSAEDDELITETLANIYLQQKNYEKAIYAFEKLSLKYPEKNIYFATRIKEAEDLKNTN